MAEDLMSLAADFVRLSSELEATREAMKRLLLNGAAGGERPFARRVSGGVEHPNAATARAAEGAIVKLLREQPGLGTSEIARETSSKPVTVADRLKRLRKKGAIVGGGRSGWSATAAG